MSTDKDNYLVHGAGLGLRREVIDEMASITSNQVDFMEVAPENWIGVGGAFGKKFRAFTERFDFVLHGLSLSIGGPSPLDEELVKSIGQLMHEHGIKLYSEHLTYCSDDGHLYDLLPIPFTEEAVHYTANRIKRVQDILGQQIAMENASYYTPAPGGEMQEIEFIRAVLDEADCALLLDVNNIYVNSINHGYDPVAFMQALPAERIAYGHIAGHYNEAEDLIIDTHGADVIDNVWQLLDRTFEHFGAFPMLLERDFNIPPIPELLAEVDRIRQAQQKVFSAPIKASEQAHV